MNGFISFHSNGSMSQEAKHIRLNKISRQHVPVTFSSFEVTVPLFFITTVNKISGKGIIKEKKRNSKWTDCKL